MRLIVNLSNNLGGGGLQVALSFLSECRHFDQNEYHVFLSPNVARQTDRSLFGKNFFFYDIPATPFWKLSRILSPLEKQIRPDVVFTVFGPSYWRPKAKHVMGYAIPHYIYPESPFWTRISSWNRMESSLRKYFKMLCFKYEADCYVVETNDANIRLRKLLSTNNVYTVSNTCSSYYNSPTLFVAPKLPPRRYEEFRLLTLSAYYPHKNLEIIPKIIDEFAKQSEGQNIRFVLTIPRETYLRIIPSSYRKWIYNVGPIPVKEGPSLYRECDAMFLSSLLECFSASYPEAMATERPIVTSDLGFAHSVCGEAAAYFDPSDPADAARKIIAVATDSCLRLTLTERGKNQLATLPTARERAECYLRLCLECYK